jgi:hypothetical protein
MVSDLPKNNPSFKEELPEPDSPIKDDSLYKLIGGEEAIQKLEDIFKQKI